MRLRVGLRVGLYAALLVWLCVGANAQWLAFGGQAGPAPVTITGSYRLIGQASNRQGSFSDKPPDLWRAEVNPTLSIYGIPITANLLVSSEQQGFQQNINAFSIALDPDAIKRIVTQRAYRALDDFSRSEDAVLLNDFANVKDSLAQYDPEKLKQLEQMRELEQFRDVAQGDITNYSDLLTNLGLMSDVEKVMTNLPAVGFGAVFPTFTPTTLSGSRIEGGYAEWNPGGAFYIAGVGGTTLRPLRRVDSMRVDTTVYTTVDNSNYGRKLYGGRVGVGQKNGEHFILTGLYSIDDASSIALPDTGVALTPQTNYLAGMDLKLEPIEGVWLLEAELNGSLTVGDQNAPSFANDDVPSFLAELVDTSTSVYYDWALTAGTVVTLRETNTKITGSLRRIGPGYRALGVPNLRTDYLRYDVRLDQRFWQRQISLGLFMRRDQDNLIPVKKATSTLFSIGGTFGLNIRKWPYLRVSYAPYVQETDAADTTLKYRNETVLWSVATGYPYRIGDLGANTNITFSRQDAVTKNNLYDYRVTSITALQSISFQFPLSVSGGLGYIAQTSTQAPDATIWTIDLSGNYALSEIFSASAGITLALDNTNGDRNGYFVSILARLGDYADIDLRAERNQFNEFATPPVLGGSYSENIFRVVVSKVW